MSCSEPAFVQLCDRDEQLGKYFVCRFFERQCSKSLKVKIYTEEKVIKC